MALNNPYTKYREQAINTATAEELTLMLYDGCLKFINISKVAIEEKNYSLANLNIQKAQNIITELMVTLNMDVEVSKNLMALYDYYNRRLVEANVKKDIDILEEVKVFITELRDTWKEAMVLSRQGK